MSRSALIGPARRAALLAPLALVLTTPSAAAQDPAALVEAAIPHDSAISEQYQRVEEVLDQAAAAVPDTPLAPAPEPAAEPEPAQPPPAPAQQYHSENVSVTQDQPSNVNVSLRINSPGDDGPVVQINDAGGDAVVEQVVEAVERPPAAPAPEPAAPAAGSLPETWEWVWTSACFGGAPRAGAAAAGWSWRWSCDAQGERAGDVAFLPDLPAAPDAVSMVEEVLAAVDAPIAAAAPTAAASGQRPEPSARPRPSSGGGADHAGRPPPAPPLARAVAADASAAPVVEPLRHVARRVVARAGPGRGDGSSSTLPAGTGPALGAVTALGTVASLLLGIWIAVLVTACVIVLPRIRHRRWSGHTWRLTRSPSSRLERPG